MRVKLSKLLSAVLAICIVFVGFTAFAADPVVTVSTTYNYNEHSSTLNGTITNKSADITVRANVTDVADDTEVTFIVNGEDGIVYINQETAASEAASFEFTADWLDVESASVSMGSDGGYNLPKAFAINPTVNYWTNASVVSEADVTLAEELAEGSEYIDENETFGEGNSAYSFTGSVSGSVREYGIRLNDGTEFRAMGCAEDGTFIVVIKNISAEEAAAAKVYCK